MYESAQTNVEKNNEKWFFCLVPLIVLDFLEKK